jgi:uncharacterized membrane protein YiaA
MNKIKLMLVFILVGLVSYAVALWFYNTKTSLDTSEYIIAAFVLIVVIFSLVVGVKKLKDMKKGYPSDDELSVRIKQKAAAKSFLYSFYLWLGIMLFFNDEALRSSIPVGLGILGMGILFIGFWIYYSKNGLDSKNDSRNV